MARLNATGSAFVWSTYLGGGNQDWSYDLELDPATGDALLAGYTFSTDFPTANPLQPANGGMRDAFLARMHAGGGILVYSTYLGGNHVDFGWDLAVDPATGDALVTGYTQSIDYPTTPGAFDRTCGTDGNCDDNGMSGALADAFVTRIGSPPVASYYVSPDSGQVQAGEPFDLSVLALDADGNVLPDYTGEIIFFTTDPKATTPEYYQFLRTDRGVASFPGGLTFRTPGVQELYVYDLATFEVFGYAAFEVL